MTCDCDFFNFGDEVRNRQNPHLTGVVIGDRNWGSEYQVRLADGASTIWWHGFEIEHDPDSEPPAKEDDDTNVVKVDFTKGARDYARDNNGRSSVMGKFKKGDEVRLIKSEDYNGHGRYGKTGEIGTVIRYDAIDHTYYVDFTESGQWWAKASNLEPSAATLKIEAGKFYKTRDGRKVGPMTYARGNIYAADGKQWRRDGYYWNGVGGHEQNDLIAEWIDEPVGDDYDTWFRAKVQESLDDTSPTIPHAEVMQSIKARIAKASNDNAKPKFKVGDRVRGVINPIEYEVLKVHANGSLDVRACGSWRQYTNQRAMDFVNITRSTAIVALIESGQPKPSSTPHVHTSTGSAEKEAKRLAAKYKGQQFGVFTLTTTHEEAAPVYDHKWQNMVAMGLKSDAISSLKTQAGITTDQARRIVYAFAA